MPHTPPDPTPLTGREQAVLASISDHEHRADARFADALAVGALPVARRPWPTRLLVLVLAALATATVVLSSAWLLAIAAVALLVVVPTGLVIWALRQGRVDPDAHPPA